MDKEKVVNTVSAHTYTDLCEHKQWNTIQKTTRPFRYDLHQIPYDYTEEVTNRFKGLDLKDRMPKELWMEVCNMYRRQ